MTNEDYTFCSETCKTNRVLSPHIDDMPQRTCDTGKDCAHHRLELGGGLHNKDEDQIHIACSGRQSLEPHFYMHRISSSLHLEGDGEIRNCSFCKREY